MNKLLIVLPIISLLTLSGILLFKEKDYTQEKSVTFEQYNICYDTHINLIQNCNTDPTYQQALDTFFAKTYSPSDITPQCQQFLQYKSNSKFENLLNLNNSYSNCYQDPQIVAIANTSSCFMTNYYDAIVIGCAGL